MSRPISQSSTAAATATRLAHTRSLSVKTSTATATATATASTSTSSTSTSTTSTKLPPNPIPATDVRLFVTNLRLLDLDLRQDWPNISTQTFSAKNADQKHRIACTEWALFRLFELWDPNETAQKLRPFFPPLEPLQSLNLRAALYRCLNELKKNGLLGRESVLRKTMLDECKGERFYDILALFSAAVLKKVLAKSPTTNTALARRLGTAPTLSNHDQRSLLPLAIAHKAALANVLRRKHEKRSRFIQFEETLDAKAKDINTRIRKCTETPRAKRPAVSQRDANAVKRQLADNWIGNQKWLSVMLHGDQVQAGDAFLSNRFDKVWHMVERGRKLEDAAPEAGLLEDLQSRVQEQQQRLQKWKAYHEELRGDSTKDLTTGRKVPAPMKTFTFEAHTQYQLPAARQVESVTVQRPTLRPPYLDILSDMDSELARVSESKPQQAFTTSRQRRTSSSALRTKRLSHPKPAEKAPPSPAWRMEPKTLVTEPKTLVREQKALFEGLSNNANALPQRQPSMKAAATDTDAAFVGHLSTLRIAAPKSAAARSPIRRRFQPQPEPTPASSHDSYAASSSPLPSNRATPSSELSPSEVSPFSAVDSLERSAPALSMPNFNPEEALADQIINAIGNATPSPVKKPQPRMSMSLVERTRMTLSRTPSFEPVPESPDISPAPPTAPPTDAGLSNVTSLLERTRLSMAAMSTRSRAQETTTKPKPKPTSSLLPINPSDTPRARRDIDAIAETNGSGGDQTPHQDDIDYDHVFKSRPRIATSPMFSPEKYDVEDAYEEEITGIDLGDVDQSDGEEGFTVSWAESPSRRR